MLYSQSSQRKKDFADSRADLKAGFTLIEVLIAIVIIGVGCLGMVAMQSSAMKSGSQADQMTVASFLAESQIEAMRTLQYNTIKDGTYTAETLTREGTRCEAGESRCIYLRTTTVSDKQPTSWSKLIEVKVSWKNIHGATQTVAYESAITDFNF